MQRPKIQNPGWAAFDRLQQEKEGTGSKCAVEPFPSISQLTYSAPTSGLNNNFAPFKSFSAVVRPTQDHQMQQMSCKSGALGDNSGRKCPDHPIAPETSLTPAVKLLKDVHNWADVNVIEDILAAVDHDIHRASVLLEEMVSPDHKLETAGISGPSLSTNKCSCGDTNKCLKADTSVENKLQDDAYEVLVANRLISVPAEPEWKEDDVYLNHRKDAIKIMRAASHHSRVASNSFLRGDHSAAHQFSLRAREEWMSAEMLNNKAAEEIFRIRNINNDNWKIDLHGLHATEAVNALKNHLHKIESEIMMSRAASSERLVKLEATIEQSPLLESISTSDAELKTKKSFPQHRQTVLEVITGSGNHSKGQASLPAAVRSFLIENGYRFDEARPGVIAVRPKFRRK